MGLEALVIREYFASIVIDFHFPTSRIARSDRSTGIGSYFLVWDVDFRRFFWRYSEYPGGRWIDVDAPSTDVTGVASGYCQWN